MSTQDIKEYHLHKYDPSKIQLAVKELRPYLDKHHEKAIRAHRHSYYQIIIFKSAGRHYVDYEVVDHEANTVFALNPGQIHYFCPKAINDGFIIQFNEQFLLQFDPAARDAVEYNLFNEIGPEHITIGHDCSDSIDTLLELLQNELDEKRPQFPNQSYFLLRAIITLLERALMEKDEGTLEKDKDFEVALKFKRLIKEHIDSFPGMEEYSEWLHISSKTLTRITKQYLHDTPANVIKLRKILEAKRLLANKNMNVKQVGYALGFDEPSYFTKYFKKVEGIKPKEFQQSIP